MRNLLLLSVVLLVFSSLLEGQENYESFIPFEWISTAPSGDERAGSCASPDGAIMMPELGGYPTYPYLFTNGYCYIISPAVKNATYCFTFTSIGTTAELNAGFSYTATGGFSLWFDNFKLYTCAPACTLVGTGLTFTGLTVGQCYTWCFQTHMTGGGGSGGFTSLCPYYIYVVPLPIELTEFYCIYNDYTMVLNWETLSETNCDRFDILRSNNGIDFEQIGTVNGNGTTTNTHKYSFSDNSPSNLNYYKLRQVDFDGNLTYSDVITGDFNATIIATNYYNLLGEMIDITSVQKGMYIKETVTLNRQNRELFYKSF
jgi:hypothetical protein